MRAALEAHFALDGFLHPVLYSGHFSVTEPQLAASPSPSVGDIDHRLVVDMRSHIATAATDDRLQVIDYLAAHRVFGVLPQLAINELGPKVIERKYPKGHFLFYESDPPSHVFVLVEGLVVLAESDERGHSHPILTFGPGDTFGLATTVLNILRRSSACALVDARALLIPKNVFADVYARFAPLCYQIAKELALMLCRSERTTTRLTLNTVSSRIARIVLESSDNSRSGAASPPYGKLSHQDFALLLGTTRETVTRALGRLTRDGLIVLRGQQLVVLNSEKLRRVAED